MTLNRSMTRQQVREVDRLAIADYAMTGLVLMENAGRGVSDLLLQQDITGTVVICCGKGNNGGDGFVIARHLEAAGVEVCVVLLTDPGELTGDAAANYAILQQAGTPLVMAEQLSEHELTSMLQSAAWIVDALLGTGLTGEVRDPYRTLIQQINAAARPVLAVDLPSGMDCDTGRTLGVCVRAEKTATFVARKLGFDSPAARELTGEVVVIPIGVPRQLLEQTSP